MTRSLPYKKQLQKLTQGQQQVKIEDKQTPLLSIKNGNKEFFFFIPFPLPTGSHFDNSNLIKLAKQLSGSVPCFENTATLEAWSTLWPSQINCQLLVKIHIFQLNTILEQQQMH